MKKLKTSDKVFLAIIVLLLCYILFKPSALRLYKDFKKSLVVKDEKIVKELDSIKIIRLRERQDYEAEIEKKDNLLRLKLIELDNANQKIIKNEKALRNYRDGNFNDRFIKFSELITEKDSI